jgi:hypothetical protein
MRIAAEYRASGDPQASSSGIIVVRTAEHARGTNTMLMVRADEAAARKAGSSERSKGDSE